MYRLFFLLKHPGIIKLKLSLPKGLNPMYRLYFGMNDSKEETIQMVKLRLNTLEGVEMEEWLHNLIVKIDGLTEDQRSQLVEVLKRDLTFHSKQVQILGGNQNIGQQQFIFQEESIGKLAGTLESLATTIKEQYGPDIGAEIIKTAIMAFANALSK
jgi:hypothetical protein